jgi:hypothetical protein
MHHPICGLIFSPSSPEKRKASSPVTVGWPWPEVGEDGEDAWFGVFHDRLLFLYNKIK